MKKIYLLPLSLLLLNPGYATEEAAPLDPSEYKIEATSYVTDTSVLENLENEISSMLEEDALISYDEELEAQKAKKQMRRLNQKKETAATEDTQQQPAQKNVRRYTKRKVAPKTEVEQVETSQAEESAVERPVTRSEQRYAERKKAVKAQAQTEKVDAEQYQEPAPKVVQVPKAAPAKTAVIAPVVEEEYEEPVQPKKAPQKIQPRAQAPKAPAKTAIAEPAEEVAELEYEEPVQPKKAPQKIQPRAHRAQAAKAPAKTAIAEPAEEVAEQEYKEPVQQKKVQPRTPKQSTPAQKKLNKSSTAQASNQPRAAQKKKVAQNGDNKDYVQNVVKKKPIVYNTAARPYATNGYDFFMVGDVLLWQATEENLTYVYSGSDTPTDHKRDLHTVDFNWDWGFRLGLGYNAPRDGWDIDLYWTHIRNNASDSKHEHSSDRLYQVFGDANAAFPGIPTKASATWHVHLDQLDLELGREFFVGKHLTVRPYVGMRSAWIFQDYDVHLSNETVKQKADLNNRYWGFGFLAGMESDWELGWDFSIYGNADMAVLLGFFDVDQTGKQDGTRIWSQDKSFRTGRAIFDAALGLKWNRLFCDDKFGLTLKVGYEYHLYFDQNQFLLSNGNADFELFNPAQGNLAYQGVIGSIQFDF